MAPETPRLHASGAISAKERLRGFFETVWNGRDLSAFDDFVREDFMIHGERGSVTQGIEPFRRFTKSFLDAVPDYRIELLDLVAEGDKVVVRWVCHGTHAGDLFGLKATRRPFSLTGISIYRVQAGKLAEVWRERDFPSTWRQLLPGVEFTDAGLPKLLLAPAALLRP